MIKVFGPRMLIIFFSVKTIFTVELVKLNDLCPVTLTHSPSLSFKYELTRLDN